MDETYIKVNGQWKYLYRAVEKAGQTIDFLLTACKAATCRGKQRGRRELRTGIRIATEKGGNPFPEIRIKLQGSVGKARPSTGRVH